MGTRIWSELMAIGVVFLSTAVAALGMWMAVPPSERGHTGTSETGDE